MHGSETAFHKEWWESETADFKLEPDKFTNRLTANAFNRTGTGDSEALSFHLRAWGRRDKWNWKCFPFVAVLLLHVRESFFTSRKLNVPLSMELVLQLLLLLKWGSQQVGSNRPDHSFSLLEAQRVSFHEASLAFHHSESMRLLPMAAQAPLLGGAEHHKAVYVTHGHWPLFTAIRHAPLFDQALLFWKPRWYTEISGCIRILL